MASKTILFLVIAAAFVEPLMVDQVVAENAYLGCTVTVRGFAYHIENKQWVLASEAQLRSCCLRKAGAERLFFVSDLSPENNGRVLTVTGRLVRENGEAKLEGAEPLASKPRTEFWLTIAALGAVAILGSLALRGRRPRPQSAR